MKSSSFKDLIDITRLRLKEESKEVSTDRWQGWNIKGRPDYVTHELLNYHCTVSLYGIESLDHWREDIKPNLPWADNHFLERVCGMPINPGIQWENWPWGKAANKHRDKNAKFNHNYMERLWPKYAGLLDEGTLTAEEYAKKIDDAFVGIPPIKQGIYFQYGDLKDLVDYLVKEPSTRQAWIPLFFPEDTGFGDGGRKPCTLGYQFIVRENQLHIYYPLRSCDFIRHFKDDIYLAIRLLLWILDECRKQDPGFWNEIKPGTYTMHCTSLHVFTNDYINL